MSYEIPGGADGLRLFPQTPEESAFTAAERAIVEESLRRWPGLSGLTRQFEAGRVKERQLTGYGAYIHLEVPAQLRGDSAIVRNGCAASNFWWRFRDDAGLSAICLAREGLLTAVELFPVAGEGYTVDECERILSGPIEDLTFHW